MYCYKLYNYAAMNSLQGSILEFYAQDHAQAIALGKGYAEKLGWTAYSIDYPQTNFDIVLFECKGE